MESQERQPYGNKIFVLGCDVVTESTTTANCCKDNVRKAFYSMPSRRKIHRSYHNNYSYRMYLLKRGGFYAPCIYLQAK